MRIGRRGAVVAGAVVAVAAAAAVTAGVVSSGPAENQARPTGPAATAPITRQTLRALATVNGNLGYGAATSIVSKAPGTVTWLPRVGATIDRGEAVLRADDTPVVLLYGLLPAYRNLSVRAKGRDVLQFEQNLSAMGYQGFTVDETYSSYTARAVKLWQRDLGVAQTGAVLMGQVIYAPGRLRVAERRVLLGAPAAAEVITATGNIKIVTAEVPVAEATWAVRNAAVSVELPSGRHVPGRIAQVGTQASAPQSDGGAGGAGAGAGAGGGGDSGGGGNPQAATVTVTVSIANQRALQRLEQAPVLISHTSDERRNVLTVPVIALLALAEGGYGVEVVDGSTTRIVAVQTGLVAEGRVEIRSPGLRAGQRVGIPG
jgi:peptidoglycan hydrolase-like protein with peptidoglycan-binding domain